MGLAEYIFRLTEERYSSLIQNRNPLYLWAFQVIEGNPRLRELEGMEIRSGLSFTEYSEDRFIKWLMWRAEQIGKENALNDLERYLGSDCVEVFVAIWVKGITASQTVDFCDDLAFIPFDSMPDSAFAVPSFNNASGWHQFERDGALVKRLRLRKARSKEERFEQEIPPTHYAELFMSAIDDVMGLISVLQLIHGVRITQIASAELMPNEIPYGLFRYSGEGSMFDYTEQIDLVIDSVDIQKVVDFELLTALYIRLKELRKTDGYGLILLAVRRLSRAKRYLDIVEEILDLTIALEMLLLKHPKDRSGRKQRFANRGSALLGSDIDSREAIRKDLVLLYDLRSTVVHEGSIQEEDRGCAYQKRDRFESLVEDAAKTIILNGWPDWEELVRSDVR